MPIAEKSSIASFHAINANGTSMPESSANPVNKRVSRCGGGRENRDEHILRFGAFQNASSDFLKHLKNKPELKAFLQCNPRIPAPIPEIGDFGIFNVHGTYNASHMCLDLSDIVYEERFFGKVVEETKRLIWVVDLHRPSAFGKQCYAKDFFCLGIINWLPCDATDIPAEKPEFDDLKLNRDELKAVSLACGQCYG